MRLFESVPRVPVSVIVIVLLALIGLRWFAELDSRQRDLVRGAVEDEGYTFISADEAGFVGAERFWCGRNTDVWEALVRTPDGAEKDLQICVGTFSARILH